MVYRSAASLPMLLLILASLIIAIPHTVTAQQVELKVTPEITIGDSEVAEIVLEMKLINTYSVEDVVWGLSFDKPELFWLDKASAEVYYVNPKGERYNITGYGFKVDPSLGSIKLEFSVSTDMVNSTVYAIVRVPAKNVITGGIPTKVDHIIYVWVTAEQQPQSYGFTTNISIVYREPRVTIAVSPRLDNVGFGTPGTVFTIVANASDPSGVYNLSIQIFNETGSLVLSKYFGPSDTENKTSVSFTISWKGVEEGRYRVVVKAFDTLCMQPPGEASASIIVGSYVLVPQNFTTISEALAYEGVGDGAKILVSGVINESSTVVINKTVTIEGVDGAKVVFSNVSVGFEIRRPVTISNIDVEGAEAVFKIINVSQPVTISNIDAYGKKFLVIEAPYTKKYWNHSVVNCSLNNLPVLYLTKSTNIVNGRYAEVFTIFGEYNLVNTTIDRLVVVNSTMVMNLSSVDLVEAVGSNLVGYNTTITQWSAIDSVYRGLKSIDVKVLFVGKPVEGAYVYVENSLGKFESHTDADGKATLWCTTDLYTDSKMVHNTTAIIVAAKKGLVNRTVIKVVEPTSIMLYLPEPKINISLVDPFTGQPITKLIRGAMVKVVIDYDLLTYVGKANISIVKYVDGVEKSRIIVYLDTNRGSVVAYLFMPFSGKSFSIKVLLELEELPFIEKYVS